VLVPRAAAGGATAFVSGITSIVLEADRASLRGKLSAGACTPGAASRVPACDALAERYEQRNIALGVALGAAVAGGLLAGAARIAFGLEQRPATPIVALAVHSGGAGLLVGGAW
jgi:hypothetical protein